MTDQVNRAVFTDEFKAFMGADFEAFVLNLERSPTLVGQLNKFFSEKGGRVTTNPSPGGGSFLSGNRVVIDPSKFTVFNWGSARNTVLGIVIAHELGHAVVPGGTNDEGYKSAKSVDEARNIGFQQEVTAILNEYKVAKELGYAQLPGKALANGTNLMDALNNTNNSLVREILIREYLNSAQPSNAPLLQNYRQYYELGKIAIIMNVRDLDWSKVAPGDVKIYTDRDNKIIGWEGTLPWKDAQGREGRTTVTRRVASQTLLNPITVTDSGVTTIFDSQGTRTVVTQMQDGHLTTTIQWIRGGTVIETALASGGATRTVSAIVGGEAVTATYTVAADGSETIGSIDRISGVAPLNPAAVKAVLNSLKIGSADLARMSDNSSAFDVGDSLALSIVKGNVVNILVAFDPTKPFGFIDANPALRGAGNLLAAIKSGKSSLFSFSESDLARLTALGSNSALLPLGAAGSTGGNTDALNELLLRQLNLISPALDLGDVGKVLAQGLRVTSSTVMLARDVLIGQAANVSGRLGDLYLARDLGHQVDLEAIAALEVGYDDLQATIGALSEVSAGIAVVVNGIEAIQSFVNGDIVTGVIDSLKTVALLVALFQPQWAPIIFAVVAVVSVFQTILGALFGGGSPIPYVPQGTAHLIPNGFGGVGVSLDFDYQGGGVQAQTVLNSYIGTINSLVQTLRTGGFADAALIPERLNIKLDKQGWYGWLLTYTDENGYTQSVNFNAPVGAAPHERAASLPWDHPDYFRQDFGNTLVDIVLRGAIGHQWEADTVRAQVASHAGYGGQSALTYMTQRGLMETDTASPSVTAKLITLDFPGTGWIPPALRSSGRGVTFDLFDNGYANSMDWVAPRVGILGLDRDNSGSLDNGRDLLNDMRFKASARGQWALDEFDVNGDRKITAADPVMSQLKVWRDYNQDGVQQAAELNTLAELGITSLDYVYGSFTQNGVQRLLATTYLNADREGVITRAVNGGIVVTRQSGATQELVTQVGDLTERGQYQISYDGQIGAGADLINGVQNVPLDVNVSQLLANDWASASMVNTLYFSSLYGSYNGTVQLSADWSSVRFTPNPNFSGTAGFNYILKDGAGRAALGNVTVNIAHVNQAPTVTASYNQTLVGTDGQGFYWWTDPVLYPTVTINDPYSGRLNVADPDDAGGFTYRVTSGTGSVDQNGNWWYAPRSFDGSFRAFEVEITDPHGASVIKRVLADATRIIATPPGGGGGGGGDGGGGDGGGWGGDGSGGNGTPVALDLDGNGIRLADHTVNVDFGGGNGPQAYAWIEAPDGFLAYDGNGNGKIDVAAEISFVRYKPGARTDLEGLGAFDTNEDGVVNATDSVDGGFQFNRLRVWRDLDEDGIADAGEVISMEEAGLEAIALPDTEPGAGIGVGKATYYGAATVIKADGTTILAADLALKPVSEGQFNPVADLMGFSATDTLANGVATIKPDGSVEVDLSAATATGDRKQIAVSADFRTVTYRLFKAGDDTGDWILDREATVITDGDGSQRSRVVDIGGGASWESIERTHDASTLLRSETVLNDDGSRRVFQADPEGLPDLIAVVDIYDNQGRHVQQTRTADGGSMTRTSWDYSGGEAWTQLDEMVTAAGERMGAAMYLLPRGGVGNGSIRGNGSDNPLDGGAGADRMAGGAGDDTYLVDDADDVVWESTGAAFTIPDGRWVVKGTADYNNDGEIDIVVSTGAANMLLLLSDGAILDWYDLPNRSAQGWELIGVTNQNGDSYADLIYRNANLGLEEAYYMSGGLVSYSARVTHATPNAVLPLEAMNQGTDTVIASVSYVLPRAVENLTLADAAGAIDGTGNDADNAITGNQANNVVRGAAGDDLLAGGAGDDTLIGGTGADTLVFRRGDGRDRVLTAVDDGSDTIEFASGIAHDQLWFARSRDDLVISVIGEEQAVTVADWFVQTGGGVERVIAGDGYEVADTAIAQLVQAMTAFDPPAAGQANLPPSLENTLRPSLAATWTHT